MSLRALQRGLPSLLQVNPATLATTSSITSSHMVTNPAHLYHTNIAQQWFQQEKSPCSSHLLHNTAGYRQYSVQPVQQQTIQDIKIVNGLPQIIVPLPSRNEKCVFSLKPVSHNVGDFVDMLKFEDKGIDSVFIKNTDGVRIASKTNIQTLFDQEFDIYINDNVFHVVPPKIESLSGEELKKISDVKYLISQLYEALNIQDFHVQKEAMLVKELEALKKELKPLEDQKLELEDWAEKRTSLVSWVGLGLMSVQFGVLARLTWWEYSWDIMEPVTYFVTYGTAVAAYAYFVLTKEEYLFNDAAKRTWLMSFHKKADKHRWDVEKYNKLKQGILSVEGDLKRLRTPIQTVKSKYLPQDGKSAGIFGINNLKDVLNKMQ